MSHPAVPQSFVSHGLAGRFFRLEKVQQSLVVVLRQQLMSESTFMSHMLSTESPGKLNPMNTLASLSAFGSLSLGLCPRMVRLLTEQFMVMNEPWVAEAGSRSSQSHQGKYNFPPDSVDTEPTQVQGEGVRLFLDGRSVKKCVATFYLPHQYWLL